MENNNNTSRNVGFSFTTIAFILSMIFMVLNFCGKITWAWGFVFLPLIIAIGLDIVLVLIVIIIFVILALKR